MNNTDPENFTVVIMALNPSLTKSLIMTPTALILCAFVMGFADWKNVLAVITVYAAVLVVFVVTSGTSQRRFRNVDMYLKLGIMFSTNQFVRRISI